MGRPCQGSWTAPTLDAEGLMNKRAKRLTKRERKDLHGKGPSGVLHARQIADAEQGAQQIDALRSSGVFGSPEEFDDSVKALADAGLFETLGR